MVARKNLTALILGIMLSAGMVSCENWMIEKLLERNEPSGGGNGGDSTVDVTGVEITNGTERRGEVGSALVIRAEVYPANATSKEVKWTSNNPEIADVAGTANGATVQLFGVGSTEIKVKTANGEKEAVCTITVVPAGSGVVVTGISLNRYSLRMEEGDSAETLEATVLATSVTDQTISWASSNTDVATVDASSGQITLVTPVGLGSTDITASVSGITPAVCRVTVSESTNLAIKFNATGTGRDLVADTFQKIHNYLSGLSVPLFINMDKKIRLGDYVELADLAVAEYPTGDPAGGKIEAGSLAAQPDRRRLMVVGINSFNPGANGRTSYTGGVTPAIPHIVMQFKDTPVDRRMEQTNRNDNGYSGSEMRNYLISGSGRFYTGLKDAGVPVDNGAIIWAPKRYVANKGNGATSASLIEDKIWLPTEREIFRGRKYSVEAYETEINQTWLEYYISDDRRKKPSAFNGGGVYWLASPYYDNPPYFFCAVNRGVPDFPTAPVAAGVAPAFCVK
ncbi:MAG: Ig-like domain-containing protein [Spirochaetaceae bacterium]|jgi:hypothetical protein|nr:Ig-like domain-containing protein [Spirochaetaceae bacterium]